MHELVGGGLIVTIKNDPMKGAGTLLIVMSLTSGILGSWLFQTVRPFDWYHEPDGSMPGWEAVAVFSDITVRCCFVALVAVMDAALARRSSISPIRAGGRHPDQY
jgi:hypothetical protein